MPHLGLHVSGLSERQEPCRVALACETKSQLHPIVRFREYQDQYRLMRRTLGSCDLPNPLTDGRPLNQGGNALQTRGANKVNAVQ